MNETKGWSNYKFKNNNSRYIIIPELSSPVARTMLKALRLSSDYFLMSILTMVVFFYVDLQLPQTTGHLWHVEQSA